MPDMAPETPKPVGPIVSAEAESTFKPDRSTRLDEVQKFLVDGAEDALK